MSVRGNRARANVLASMDEGELAKRMADTFEMFSVMMLNTADETRRNVRSESGHPIGIIFNAIRAMSSFDNGAAALDEIVTAMKNKHGIDPNTDLSRLSPKSKEYLEWLAAYDALTMGGRNTIFGDAKNEADA